MSLLPAPSRVGGAGSGAASETRCVEHTASSKQSSLAPLTFSALSASLLPTLFAWPLACLCAGPRKPRSPPAAALRRCSSRCRRQGRCSGSPAGCSGRAGRQRWRRRQQRPRRSYRSRHLTPRPRPLPLPMTWSGTTTPPCSWTAAGGGRHCWPACWGDPLQGGRVEGSGVGGIEEQLWAGQWELGAKGPLGARRLLPAALPWRPAQAVPGGLHPGGAAGDAAGGEAGRRQALRLARAGALPHPGGCWRAAG